jgi:hypothetical protein
LHNEKLHDFYFSPNKTCHLGDQDTKVYMGTECGTASRIEVMQGNVMDRNTLGKTTRLEVEINLNQILKE